MINPIRLRALLRWSHIGVASFLVVYVYSPFHANPVWTDIARFGVLPLVSLSGAWMWQQRRVTRSIRALRMTAAGVSATPSIQH